MRGSPSVPTHEVSAMCRKSFEGWVDETTRTVLADRRRRCCRTGPGAAPVRVRGGLRCGRRRHHPRPGLRGRGEQGGEGDRRHLQQDVEGEGRPGHHPGRRLPGQTPDDHQQQAGARRLLQLGRRQHQAVRRRRPVAPAGPVHRGGPRPQGEVPAVRLQQRGGRRRLLRGPHARDAARAALPQRQGPEEGGRRTARDLGRPARGGQGAEVGRRHPDRAGRGRPVADTDVVRVPLRPHRRTGTLREGAHAATGRSGRARTAARRWARSGNWSTRGPSAPTTTR